MQHFTKIWLSLLLAVAAITVSCPAAMGDEPESASIKIRPVADGLVVIATSNQVKQDDITFGCNQEKNEITVDLPVRDVGPLIESLQKNPLVSSNGVSALALSQRKMKRFTIVPTLKLYCSEAKLVSKFQRYVSYSYPAGRELRLNSAEVKGFDYDDRNPRAQVKGSIILKFADPLGDIDLAKAIKVEDNSLSLRLQPRDFSNQGLLKSVFLQANNLVVNTTSAESSGEYGFDFRTISNADIDKIAAKLVKSPTSNEARIDITLTVALNAAGKKFYEKGDSARAIRYLEAAKNEPGLALVARMSMGTIFWNEDNHAEASRNFGELIELDRSWEFPEARYYAAKTYYLTNNRLSFELSNRLKEFLRRCDRTQYSTCDDARELSDQVNEPALKLNAVTKAEMKKLVARLADPKQNFNEVQKNIFHYWATWCPVCLEEMPRIMRYAVAHPNVSLYIVGKYDNQKTIFNTLIKSGAIRRKNIFYYIDSKDDLLLRQMVPLVLANKEPVTPLPISVFLQREVPFYLTDSLEWTDAELGEIWKLKYRE